MPEPTPATSRLWKSLTRPSRGQAVVGVLLGILAFGTVTQVRVAGQDGTYANLRQSELVQALDGLQAASRQAERDIAELEETRDRLQSATQRRSAALEQARAELRVLGVLAGTLPAAGPGVRVTVRDPENSLRLTHLLDGIEELRNAGMEAMEINDRVRVVAQTSLEDTPDGIRVDGVELKAPYVLDAIGPSSTLATALDFDGGFIDDVRIANAEVSVKQLERVEVSVTRTPAAPRYAEPVTGQ